MTGGSIGHCTTGSVLVSTGASNAAFIRIGSAGVVSIDGCANGCADTLSTTSCKDSRVLADEAAASTPPIPCASPPEFSTPTDDGPVFAAATAPSAPLLRARLAPARSVQRAAFSAILRSVSWTLAGGEILSPVAIGRVYVDAGRRMADVGVTPFAKVAAGDGWRCAMGRSIGAAAPAGPGISNRRFASAAAFAIEPAAAPVAALPAAPDAARAAAIACATFAAAPGSAAAATPAAAAKPAPAPNEAAGRCSPAERRPTCKAASRGAAPDVPTDAPTAPARTADPAADPPARGAVSRNHPAGATGSVGIKAAFSAFSAGVCIDDACRGDVAVPVRSTGSTCVVWLRGGVAAPARQLDLAPRAVASLPAVALEAPNAPEAPAALAPVPARAPRRLAGGRQTVGRA